MDYERLYNAYYMQVYSYVMTLAKNRALAEELSQQTFFKAISSKAGYRKGAGELTWLCAIAKNLFYDEMRRQNRFTDMPPDDDTAASLYTDSRTPDIENAAADDDAAYRIHEILHRLEEPYKEVFSLRVFGELPFVQIASLFGKTESWARVTYHRARLKIQERMDLS